MRGWALFLVFLIALCAYLALNAVPAHAMLIEGTSGNDNLQGTSAADTIKGYGGKDFEAGGSSGDILWGGSGADQLVAGNGVDDKLHGDDGDDQLDGITGNCSPMKPRTYDGGPGFDVAYYWPSSSPGFTGQNTFKSIEQKIPGDTDYCLL